MKTAFGCLVLLIVICGCGGGVSAPPEVTDPEALAIQEVIDSINGAEKDQWKDLFAGTPPKQKEFQEKYQVLFCATAPKVTVNGDSAEVAVDVSQVAADGFNQTDTRTWTMKRVDGKWKVETVVTE